MQAEEEEEEEKQKDNEDEGIKEKTQVNLQLSHQLTAIDKQKSLANNEFSEGKRI